MSVPFDIGGIVGAVLAGYYADKTGASGLTCIVMLFFAIPSLFMYQLFASYSLLVNILLQTLAGILVNGPYCLITTAVAADLGNSVTDRNAMATITAIIDGTGSIGAGVGPLLAGVVSTHYGWSSVFYMVMFADLISLILLLRIGWREMRERNFFRRPT